MTSYDVYDVFYVLITYVLQPMLLLGQIAVPTYVITYKIGWFMILEGTAPLRLAFVPGNQTAAPGVALFAVSVVLLLAWLIPLAYCHYVGFWKARRMPLQSAPKTPILQAVSTPLRYRHCSKCKIDMACRMYHAEGIDRCLPLYDHYCPWWMGAVWQDNMKAYLLALPLLLLHIVFCLAVGVWALSQKRLRMAVFFSWAVLIATPFAFVAITTCWMMWRDMVLRNRVSPEIRNEPANFLLFTNSSGDRIMIKIEDAERNPWNLGWRENLRWIMGPVWTWPLFWMSPIKNLPLGEYPHNLEDVKQPNAMPAPDRRRAERSTGFEDVELQSATGLHHRVSTA